jgi:hypothetical protein
MESIKQRSYEKWAAILNAQCVVNYTAYGYFTQTGMFNPHRANPATWWQSAIIIAFVLLPAYFV